MPSSCSTRTPSACMSLWKVSWSFSSACVGEKREGRREGTMERIIYFEHSFLASHHDFCKVCSINVIIACELFILSCGPGLDVWGLVIELVGKVLQALQSVGSKKRILQTWQHAKHTHRSSAILAHCAPTSGWAKSLFVPHTQSNTAK